MAGPSAGTGDTASSAESTRRHLGHVARGGAIGMIGSVVNAVAGLVLVLLLARGLDPAEAGRFFAASSLALLLAAVSTLGTGTGLARFMLRHEAAGRWSDVLRTLRTAALPVAALSLALGLALAALADPVAGLLGWEDGTVAVRVLAVAVPCAAVTEVALAGTQALGRMRTTAVVDRLVRAGLQAGLAGLVLALGGGVLAVTVAWTAAWLVAALLAVGSLARFLRERRPHAGAHAEAGTPPPERGAVAREFWAYTRWRGVARVAQVAVQRADVVLVAALLGPVEAAVYTAATRFVVLGQVVTVALQQVLQPRFTAILLEDDLEVLRDVFRTGTAWAVLTAWPVYLAIGAAPAVYLSVFGAGYDVPGAVAVVLVMTAAMLVAVAAGAVDTLLLMAGRSALSTANALAALVLDVVLCLVLLPLIGVAGAAVAWAASVVLRNGLATVQVRRDLGVTAGGRAVLLAAALPLLVVALPVAATALLVGGPVAWGIAVGASAVAHLLLLRRCAGVLRLDLLLAALPLSALPLSALPLPARLRPARPERTHVGQHETAHRTDPRTGVPGDGTTAPDAGDRLGAGHG